jgi:DNA-binding response OmpR family regulator
MSLAALGFDVSDAVDGDDALRSVAAARPDCIILDLTMPGMSGLELCRRLRGHPSTAEATILMLTANDDAEDKIEAFASGVDDYILKPFSPRDLSSRVQAALRRRAHPDSGTA